MILDDQIEKQVNKRSAQLKEAFLQKELVQEQLMQTERLASLGSMVAGISHEINTPVGTSLTALSYLNDSTNKIHDLYTQENMTEEEFEKYLNDAKQISATTLKNIKKASSLINSFKQLSIDQTNEEKRIFKLDEYTKEILTSLYNQLKSRPVIIKTEIDNNLEIHSYPGAYGQILSILILNSLSHAFKGDDEGIIEIKVEKNDNSLIIKYKDNGLGIKEESLPHIFEPFYTTNRASGGTGLGLNILHNIITSQLNGKIECQSKVKKGIEFLITFPLN